MKKKFINGFLMAALMFAATSSFVSCKDNIDDDLSDVYANLGKKNSELQEKINNLQTQINNIKPEIINIENHYDTTINNIYNYIDTTIINHYDVEVKRIDSTLEIINQQITNVTQQVTNNTLAIDEINNELSSIENRINGVSDSVGTLWFRVDSLASELEKFMESMVNGTIVTGVKVNATRNDVLGIINTPFFNCNGLAAYFGTNDAGIEQFPYAGIDFNVGGNRLAEYLEPYELPDEGFVSFDESDYITDTYGNAGQVYFTVNSTDFDKFDISKFAKITVENSAGEIAPIDLKVRKSSARVVYNLGRAFLEETGNNVNNGFYVADATIKEDDLEPNKFQIEKFVDFKRLQKEIKSRVADIRAIEGENRTGAKAMFKNFVRETMSIVFDLFHNKLTSYDLQSNMSYAPQRLAFYTENDGKLKRVAQTDDFELWTTAVKPLSYNTFWEYENAKEDNWVIENALERCVSRIAKEIRERFGDKGIHAKIVSINDSEESVTILINDKTETIVVSNAKYMADLKKAINVNGGLDAVNEKLATLLKTFTLGNVVDKAENRINDYLDKASDYLTNLINKHLFTRAVAPIIIFEHSTGMDRLCEGMFVKRGIMHAYLTSGTMELIVPAYRKYVALEKDGMLLQSAVLPGNTLTYDFDLSERGDYKVIISCVDYFGYVITKKYDVYVK